MGSAAPSRHFRLNVSQDSGECSVSYKEIAQEQASVSMNNCSVTEPVFVNPCSYGGGGGGAVNSVLRHIGEKSGIPKYNNGQGERQFVPVFCDGSPYNLCFRVITCTHRCLQCSTVVCGNKELLSHMAKEHNCDAEENVTRDMFSLEYDWVLLQPGPGHIEMNMVEGLTELCWDVFWRVLAQTMNFKVKKHFYIARKYQTITKTGHYLSLLTKL